MSAEDEEEELQVKFKGSKVQRIEWNKINAINLDMLLGNDDDKRKLEMKRLHALSDAVTDYNFNPEDLQLKNVDKLFRVCQAMIEFVNIFYFHNQECIQQKATTITMHLKKMRPR
jgi:hypothetical protein